MFATLDEATVDEEWVSNIRRGLLSLGELHVYMVCCLIYLSLPAFLVLVSTDTNSDHATMIGILRRHHAARRRRSKISVRRRRPYLTPVFGQVDR